MRPRDQVAKVQFMRSYMVKNSGVEGPPLQGYSTLLVLYRAPLALSRAFGSDLRKVAVFQRNSIEDESGWFND